MRVSLERPMYYRRDGTAILGSVLDPRGTLEWARLFERNLDYRRVAESTLPNGIRVSTVWLGLDHSFSAVGPPVIFESMAFAAELSHRDETKMTFLDGKEHVLAAFDYHEELDCDRYSTEAQALAGHMEMCEKWSPGCRSLPASTEGV